MELSSEKVGTRTLALYAQAQVGLNLCATLLGLHLLYFYTDRRGLSPALAGLVFFIALVADALTDPIVGNISDRARFRAGRRRPFFFAAIPMGLCYFLLLSPPDLGRGLFAWFLGCYFLMLTARKFFEIAYGALMPELTLDYDERTRLSTFRQLSGTIGDISGSMLPFLCTWLFARGADFRVTGAVAGLLVAGGAMGAFTGTRERFATADRERSGIIESLRTTFQNRPYIILLAATTLSIMAINIPTVLLRFLAKYWMHDETAAARWLIAYFAGSVVSYPVWFRVATALEKRSAFLVAIVANAIGSLMFMALTPHSTIMMYALMAFSGFSAIGMWVTQISASADVIEWDEMRTGRRQEGAYGGVTSMAIKISIAISLLLVGPLMNWIGYVPGGQGLTPQAGDHLRELFAIVPAAIYLVGALVFSRYPITRELHHQMRERLAARNQPAMANPLAS